MGLGISCQPVSQTPLRYGSTVSLDALHRSARALMPSTSVGNLLSDIRVARRPCKPFACPAGVTDKRRWIPRSAGAPCRWHLAPGDLTRHGSEPEDRPRA